MAQDGSYGSREVNNMNLYKGFDEKTFRDIAKKSQNQQAVDDVKYARLVLFSSGPDKFIALRKDNDAIAYGYVTQNGFRIIGIAVDAELMGQGVGRFMYNKIVDEARLVGCTRIFTKTLSGLRFYTRKCGMQVIGKDKGDYILEAKI